MKKILSVLILLSLALMLGAAAIAQEAAEEEEMPNAIGTEAREFSFPKSYLTTAGAVPAAYPAETLHFQVEADPNNPDGTMISISDHSVSQNPDQIRIFLPSYTHVGKWNYTVTEAEGSAQGVTYAASPFGVQVLISYGADGEALAAQISFTTKDGGEGKMDEIVNHYDLGALTITKEVSGNLASRSEKFDIDVTFTSDKPVLSAIGGDSPIKSDAWNLSDSGYTCTATVALADGESATFENIPSGVSYAVAERERHTEMDLGGGDGSKGYTVTYTAEQGMITADDHAKVTVFNAKNAEIDTGIDGDQMPYVILLSMAVLFGAVMLLRRRERRQR